MTPLLIVAQNGNTELVEPLIEKGAKVNAKNKEGNTPYCLAFENGKLETTQALIKLGAKDLEDLTPLGKIAMNGHAEIVKQMKNPSNSPATPNPGNNKGDQLDKNTKATKR